VSAAVRDVPRGLVARINLFDVLAHLWDVAVATGLPLAQPDELWTTGLDAVRTVIGPSRTLAVLGDAELQEPVVLCGEVLGAGRAAGVADQRGGHRLSVRIARGN
jgi:hypothetical protein